jgi:hypothetical protein
MFKLVLKLDDVALRNTPIYLLSPHHYKGAVDWTLLASVD